MSDGDGSYEDFSASKFSLFDNIEHVSLVSFSNDNVASLGADVLHGKKHDIKLIGVQGREHEGLLETGLQGSSSLFRLGVLRSVEVFLLVPLAEGFGTD